MENWEISAALERMAGLLALQGDNDFKVRAYSQAARKMIRMGEPVCNLLDRGNLEQLPGIGRALAGKIEELVNTGRSSFLARLESEVQPELLALFAIPGVGYKTGGALVKGLALQNMKQLEKAARDGRVRQLPGLGESLERNIIAFFDQRREGPERFHRGLAVPLAGKIAESLERLQFIERVAVTGEVRRGVEMPAGITIVACVNEDCRKESSLAEALGAGNGIYAVALTDRGALLETVYGIPATVIMVQGAGNYAAAIVQSTGSEEHWKQLLSMVEEKGLTLNAEGLFGATGEPLPTAQESELYSAIGLEPVPPELREGKGEVAASLEGRLPCLVEGAMIRGDLHLHSSWSDGTHTIEEMAGKADAIGYDYIAVTDHSRALSIAGGLDPERLMRQAAEIAEYNRAGRRCRILAGVEVDILPDGALDLPDEILSKLDLVIASVHSSFKQSRDEMTGRICRAMKNPTVHVIGHPTGRLLGSRGGYRVDVDELIRSAVQTGTFLEINASPHRLDLPEAYLRRAKEAGVRFAAGTDAHSLVTMDDMQYGVTAARRGWLEPGDLINTLFLQDLRRALEGKKERSIH